MKQPDTHTHTQIHTCIRIVRYIKVLSNNVYLYEFSWPFFGYYAVVCFGSSMVMNRARWISFFIPFLDLIKFSNLVDPTLLNIGHGFFSRELISCPPKCAMGDKNLSLSFLFYFFTNNLFDFFYTRSLTFLWNNWTWILYIVQCKSTISNVKCFIWIRYGIQNKWFYVA